MIHENDSRPEGVLIQRVGEVNPFICAYQTAAMTRTGANAASRRLATRSGGRATAVRRQNHATPAANQSA